MAAPTEIMIVVAVSSAASAVTVALLLWLNRKNKSSEFVGSWSIAPEIGTPEIGASSTNPGSRWAKVRSKATPVHPLHPEIKYGGKALPGFHFAAGASSRVVAEIDLGAISHNVSEIQKRAAATGCKLMGIVKADAYGHGAVAVSHMLHACNGLDAFGVATMDEAIELRESGLPLSVRVLVLGATHPSEWSNYSRYKLDVMINSGQQAEDLIKWSKGEHAGGRLQFPMRAHIMLNTGMSRDGLETFSKEDIPENSCAKAFGSAGNQQTYHGVCPVAAAQVIQRVASVDDSILEFVAICTHMCDAKKGSEYTVLQFRRACAVVEAVRRLGVPVPCIHLENSESLLADCIPDEELRALLEGNPPGTPPTLGYARSGGGMYGQRNHDFLKPAIVVRAQIRHVHIADKGVPVGYDRSWVAPDDVVIATLSVGFADGYHRNNSNTVVGYGKGATVVIGGRKCVVAGKVCMDMMMVNCGPGTPESLGVRVGDYAILYGTGGNGLWTLKEHADNLGTAQSDVTCDLGRRVRREYINAPEPQAGTATVVFLARALSEKKLL